MCGWALLFSHLSSRCGQINARFSLSSGSFLCRRLLCCLPAESKGGGKQAIANSRKGPSLCLWWSRHAAQREAGSTSNDGQAAHALFTFTHYLYHGYTSSFVLHPLSDLLCKCSSGGLLRPRDSTPTTERISHFRSWLDSCCRSLGFARAPPLNKLPRLFLRRVYIHAPLADGRGLRMFCLALRNQPPHRSLSPGSLGSLAYRACTSIALSPISKVRDEGVFYMHVAVQPRHCGARDVVAGGGAVVVRLLSASGVRVHTFFQ